MHSNLLRCNPADSYRYLTLLSAWVYKTAAYKRPESLQKTCAGQHHKQKIKKENMHLPSCKVWFVNKSQSCGRAPSRWLLQLIHEQIKASAIHFAWMTQVVRWQTAAEAVWSTSNRRDHMNVGDWLNSRDRTSKLTTEQRNTGFSCFGFKSIVCALSGHKKWLLTKSLFHYKLN